MRGSGIKLAITTNNPPPPARLLDITRLISRAGRVMTGVDRVEFAYLQRLLDEPEPLFAIARTTLGYVLLDHAGAAGIAARLAGQVPWGARDGLSLLARGKPGAVRQAESDLRRLCIARCVRGGLVRMLARHVPVGVAYVNTGHSNLTDRMLDALGRAVQAHIAVLVHDTIPLDFPQYTRAGIPARFEGMLRRVQARADLVIYNSQDTRARAEQHMAPFGPVPRGVVAHLGVDPCVPSHAPGGIAAPYFVTVGTIEPRKRHDVLLDVWDDLIRDLGPEQVPGLCICGARGWDNEAVFARLDALPANSPIREMPGLDDGAIAALLAGSCGLLFPSEAEGYGLPPIEAAMLGVPVVCQDLAAYREILGDIPVYASITERYAWRNSVESLTKGQLQGKQTESVPKFVPPAWDAHFNTVLSLT